jgi:tRNA pseudouridine38-40 synthase
VPGATGPPENRLSSEASRSRPKGNGGRRRGPVRLLVAYDGTDYHGFAENGDIPTVGLALRSAIEQVIGTAVELTVAGRTDAGVHAWGQVVSLDLPAGVDLARLQKSLNGLLRPAVAVRAVEPAPEGFSARFSARWRRYRYTILNRPVPDPFLARIAWHVPEPLDLPALRLAADPLVGEHDFTSFCRAPKVPEGTPPATLVRRVTEVGWETAPTGVLWFEIRANAFCHQMVRSIVGLLVDVGRGRRRAGDVLAVLRSRDRAGVGNIAPPHGLCLWEVGYPDGFGSLASPTVTTQEVWR